MSVYLSVYVSLCQTITMNLAARMRGNRTATAARRSQTGFEDRPGHQAHAFLILWQSLLHRLPVAAGEYSYVACSTGDAAGVGVLEPGLGVLQADACIGHRDLHFREQGVGERRRKFRRCAGLGDGEFGALGTFGGPAFEGLEKPLSRRCDMGACGVDLPYGLYSGADLDRARYFVRRESEDEREIFSGHALTWSPIQGECDSLYSVAALEGLEP